MFIKCGSYPRPFSLCSSLFPSPIHSFSRGLNFPLNLLSSVRLLPIHSCHANSGFLIDLLPMLFNLCKQSIPTLSDFSSS